MIKKTFLKLIWFYQRFLTLAIGYGSCRYYPSCSEYTRLQFIYNPIHTALFNSTKRVLSCNQLFDGGIDYPKTSKLCLKPTSLSHNEIKYYLIPDGKNSYHIVKNFFYKKVS